MKLRLRSLQARLAARLAIVILVAAAFVIGIILYQGYRAADELGNEQLYVRATELARLVKVDPAGATRLETPARFSQTFRTQAETDLFLVQDENGHVIAASQPEFTIAASQLSIPGSETRYFRLERFGPNGEDYYGLRLRLNSDAGPVMVTVARPSDADALAYALLRAFVRQIAWVIPLFAVATLAVAVWSIRQGLQPILAVSAKAAAISPTTISVRLSSDNLPSEIEPLVSAVNRALDRLEEGFAVQRQFTANAAHELRTPLTILTAGLDNLDGSDAVEKLRTDAARMNRLVDQLLRVARLDASPLDVRETIDLGASVAEVIEYLAPLAVAQGCSLGFEAPEGIVPVHGNANAIADAVRNVIENAVSHSPVGTEVAISVTQDGAVSVADRGRGISVVDRPHVFDRFWRGQGERGPGAGLGLAIVAEIARAHHATVDIGEALGGGALFTMRFPVAASKDTHLGYEKSQTGGDSLRRSATVRRL
jgi:signal transduction histidine kinase